MDNKAVETVRRSFRPDRITTLFVGESAPDGGAFFYLGNTAMLHHMRRAVETAHGKTDTFLDTFKSYGWYVDDLVLFPVNKIAKSKRKAECVAAQGGLAKRISDYRPLAIVSLLRSIESMVEDAAIEAGSNAPRYAVHFPGFGQQGRFASDMAEIIPKLPRLGI